MKAAIFLLFVSLFLVEPIFAQKEVARKGRVFGYWGYNRSGYAKSTFHIQGEDYDLTFKDLKGVDQPTPFSFEDYLKPANVSKPQYNYRLGYFLTDRLSISVGMDHLKYYMVEGQKASVSGYINSEEYPYLNGQYDGSEFEVPWRFLWFHHSDGLNYASIEIEYNIPVWISANKKFYADLMGNIGGGVVIPKTYVMILNEEQDNKFHLAGGGPSAKIGGRFTFWSNFFVEGAFKTGYVWMPNILVNGQGTAKAQQNIGWLEFYGAVGFSLPLVKLNN